MRLLRRIAVLAAAFAALATLPAAAQAAKPTVVLVHGAFADASGWYGVQERLEDKGYKVLSPANPLRGVSADSAYIKSVLSQISGPIVLVGHSYGGVVITNAATGNPNVKALVYIAAFAPESGEPVGAFGEKYPVDLNSALKPDSAGFLYVDRARFRELFCADVPETDARVAAATQKPIHNSAFGASVPQAAWKNIPSWYLVSQDDRAINPDLERFYAKRMGAKTSEVKASHVAFISHPDVVARLIEAAAAAAGKSGGPKSPAVREATQVASLEQLARRQTLRPVTFVLVAAAAVTGTGSR
jgi:pimeloyl-ACP methyl ester carboxylesterase